jgi:hypothetical protein
MTLRPGRDHAWLDCGIEKCLRVLQRRVPFVQVSIAIMFFEIRSLTVINDQKIFASKVR